MIGVVVLLWCEGVGEGECEWLNVEVKGVNMFE